MRFPPSCFLLVLTPLLVVQGCFVPRSSRQILTPRTNRAIPLDLLTEKLGPRQFEGYPETRDHLTHALFEVDRNGIIFGANVTIDLRTNAKPLNFDNDFDSFTFNLNGQDQKNSNTESVVVLEVGAYHVMYDDDGQVSNVWGNNILLEPVDKNNYPGVLMNYGRASLLFAGDHDAVQAEESTFKRSDREEDSEVNAPKGLHGRHCGKVEVAVAYDNMFCGRFGNSASRANAFVQSVVSKSSHTLTRDTCQGLRLSRIEAHCGDGKDPYKYAPKLARLRPRQRSSFILREFQRFWNANRRSVKRDVAYLFSGFMDLTSVAGIAYVGSACTEYGYGWVELGQQLVFLHEMGHSLGAGHTSQGIMRAFLTADIGVFFSPVSKNQMNGFLKRRRTANCIS